MKWYWWILAVYVYLFIGVIIDYLEQKVWWGFKKYDMDPRNVLLWPLLVIVFFIIFPFFLIVEMFEKDRDLWTKH